MKIWVNLYHGEKKGLEEEKEKKKDNVWQEAPKTYRLFHPLPSALLRTSHVREGPALPCLLFISELTRLNIVLMRKYTGHFFFFYCKCSALLSESLWTHVLMKDWKY